MRLSSAHPELDKVCGAGANRADFGLPPTLSEPFHGHGSRRPDRSLS